MSTHYILTGALTLACAAATTFAQAPATPQPRTPAPQTTTTDRPATTTLVGCLAREQNMPGSPDAPGRPAAMENFILTDASPAGGAVGTSGSSTGGAVGTAGSTSTTATKTAATYHVTGISEEQLKPLAGKRVEVIGRIGSADAKQPATPATGAAADANRADRAGRMEFQTTSIREMPGTCPTQPSNR